MLNLIIPGIAIVLIVYLFLKWSTRNYDLFERQGLKYLKPLPFLGSSGDTFKGIGIADRVLSTYRKFPNEKIIGFFELTTPVYFLRSPDIVKQITIKDFPYFQDRIALIDPSIDEYLGKILFSMEGKQWRDMRATLTPLFTGNKMRMMLQFIVKCTEQLVEYLQEDYDEKGLKPVRIKEILSRYTNDVIATCAFGVECDSLKNPNNEIFKIGQELIQFQKNLKIHQFLLMRYCPKIAKILGLKMLDRKVEKKFGEIILNTMEVRKREGIVRPDMLQLLMKVKDGQQTKLDDDEKDEIEGEESNLPHDSDVRPNWTDTDLLAQCFLFFLAGYDNTSTIMTFTAYELAVNSDIQEKLFEEIQKTSENLMGGSLTYESLQKMKYMDMVISEVLRKWPQSVGTDRVCVKNYSYEDSDGLKFTIEKGSMICVPIYALHMDPKYFSNPEKFYPERFSAENIVNKDLATHLSFGIGPRSCIGLRFALMEMKTSFFYLLLKFRIKVCEETDVPLKLKKSIMGLVPNKEIKLYLEPRNYRNVNN